MTSDDDPSGAFSPTPLGPAVPPGTPRGAGLSLDDFILLTEEIAGMARAGLPLDRGLAALREMGGGRLQRVTASIASDLTAGYTLPEALDRQTGRVPAFYARLMAAGIRTGKLADVLGTLTMYARTLADLRSVIVGALFYPCIVMLLAAGLVIGLSIFLVPQFEQIFRGFRMKLPWSTEFMIFVSNHAVEFFVIPPVVVLGTVLVCRWLMRRTGRGRQLWARLLYRVPLVGPMVRSARLAAFTDVLGILVDNGLPLPEAFELAGEACADPLMAVGAQQIRQGLLEGRPLGEAIGLAAPVPEVVGWMIGLGEKRGTLGATLHQVADMYRRHVEMRANLLRSILPPFFIVVVAGMIVSLFLMAFLMPMVGLLEGLGGGNKK